MTPVVNFFLSKDRISPSDGLLCNLSKIYRIVIDDNPNYTHPFSDVNSQCSPNAPCTSSQPLPSLYKSKPPTEGSTSTDAFVQRNPEKLGLFKFSEDVSAGFLIVISEEEQVLEKLVFAYQTS